MRMKLVWFLVQVAPVAVSVMGISAFSVCAAEVPSSPESDRSPIAPAVALPAESLSELTIRPSSVINSISSEPKDQPSGTTDIIFQDWSGSETGVDWQISNTMISTATFSIEEKETENNRLNYHLNDQLNQTIESASIQSLPELENLISNREDLSEAQPDQLIVSDMSGEAIANASFSATETQLIPIAPSVLEPFASGRWQIAQAETSPEPDVPEDVPETAPEPEETSHSPRWHVTFTPYGFVPLNVDGSATVRDFTADFNVGLDDILNSLSFAAAGRVEVWRGNLGFIFDGAYFNVGQEDSRSLPIPNCLCNIFPSEIDTEVNVQYGQFDLGVGYRVGANLSNAATEFDMGPLVFDAIVGMRIYTLHQEIDISTNVGTGRNLENSNTFVQPLVSGRMRWNVTPKLAGWVRGDLAGFGIGGTLMAASVTGGLDWMFSGNTSLLLAYRFSSLRYNTEIRGEDFDLDLLMQGPYMGIVFRF